MGFDAYFLIVWDLCRYAREQGIWYEARGSAAGSMVAYVLDITLVEPLAHGLLFERFLNPDRISMPDIDLDFQDDKRAEIMEYCAEQIRLRPCGPDHHLRHHGRARRHPRCGARDGYSAQRGGPHHQDDPAIPQPKPVTSRDALNADPGAASAAMTSAGISARPDRYAAADGRRGAQRRHARRRRGHFRSAHAWNMCRCTARPTNSEDTPIKTVTQFEMSIIDHLGLLKVDFLGLATLTIMQKASDLI